MKCQPAFYLVTMDESHTNFSNLDIHQQGSLRYFTAGLNVVGFKKDQQGQMHLTSSIHPLKSYLNLRRSSTYDRESTRHTHKVRCSCLSYFSNSSQSEL